MVSRSTRASCLVATVASLLLLLLAGQAQAQEITNSGEDLRTGWYPTESLITPELIKGGTFGEEWSTPVEGQVYAQPLLDAGTLLVATEQNDVYGLDPASGAIKWSKTLPHGTPWNPADIGCADLTPSIGVTSTPVIDPSTGIAYLTHRTYASGSSGPSRWYMDAISVATGEEQPGFPVELAGEAQNLPGLEFDPTDQLQRPGLLLMGGVVYAGFGSDCDYNPYQGWVFGVSESGQVKARWASDPAGAGIWQSGAGLTSDGPGTILLSTGNGYIPEAPIPSDEPPIGLGQSVVRLRVQPNGTLKATEFFAPYDAETLNTWDADFGSGGVTGLPSEYFGTAAIPDLAVVVGKDGYVYLLNRNELGGFGEGAGGEDKVVQRLGPRGGVWSRPGVWPGEGGWIYIPTASGGNSAGGSAGNLDVYRYGLTAKGVPSLSLAGSSAESFGFSSSAPVITSNGTTAGSALVWVVWAPNGSGEGAQLRAYLPKPVNEEPVLVWSEPIGTSAKFAIPGVGLGRLYLGTRDGHVLGFGSPVTPALTGSVAEFPATVVGEHSAEQRLTLTATEAVTITKVAPGSSQFKLGTLSRSLPAALSPGQAIEVPISFWPTATGPQAATLTVSTESGKTVPFSLSGTGLSATAKLEIQPPVLTLGGTSIGKPISGTARFLNVGAAALTIKKVTLPTGPFVVEPEDAPTPGMEIKADDGEPGELDVPVQFRPTEDGSFEGHIELQTTGGNGTIAITATASPPGELHISPELSQYGSVAVGGRVTKYFSISNSGGLPVKINLSKPPIANFFHATTKLEEGESQIEPHENVVESVEFAPSTPGAWSDVWQIAGEDASGLHRVTFTGTGIAPASEGKASEPTLVTSSVGQGVLGFQVLPDAVLSSSALTAASNGTVAVHVRCPTGESSCQGTVTLRTLHAVRLPGARHASVLTLASAGFKVAGGHVAAVLLRLSHAGRTLLAHQHLLHLRVLVAAHDPAGLHHLSATTVTLRAAHAR